MKSIQIKKEFPAPIADVFNLLAQYARYNIAFAPIQVEHIKDLTDLEHLDGVGSVRRMGFGSVTPLKEQITLFAHIIVLNIKLLKICWSNIILGLLSLKK